MTDQIKKPRGLAALSPERRREIQAMGGKAGKGNPNRPWAKDPSLASKAGSVKKNREVKE